MIASVFIEPHERHEAVEAYRDKLSPAQIEQIEEAPEGAVIKLQFGIDVSETRLVVTAA